MIHRTIYQFLGAAALTILIGTGCTKQETIETTEPTAVFYYNPAWSPDGSRIAYYTNRDGNYEIYTVNVDGSGEQRLTNNEFGDGEMAWSPDGSKIAFSSNRSGSSALYLMNADGSNQALLSEGVLGHAPAWSPLENTIAFEGRIEDNNDIFLIDVDGSSGTRLTANPANDFRPTWSPDGRQIAFSTKRTEKYSLFVMNIDGSDLKPLVSEGTHAVSPMWSPDGKTLLFTKVGDGASIYTLDLATGQQKRITAGSALDNTVSWSPDGKQFAYLTEDADGMAINTMNIDGSNIRRVVPR